MPRSLHARLHLYTNWKRLLSWSLRASWHCMLACLSTKPGSHEPSDDYMPAGSACPLALLARWHCMPARTTCPLVYIPAGTTCPPTSRPADVFKALASFESNSIPERSDCDKSNGYSHTKSPKQTSRKVDEVFLSKAPHEITFRHAPAHQKPGTQEFKNGNQKCPRFWGLATPFPFNFVSGDPDEGVQKRTRF